MTRQLRIDLVLIPGTAFALTTHLSLLLTLPPWSPPAWDPGRTGTALRLVPSSWALMTRSLAAELGWGGLKTTQWLASPPRLGSSMLGSARSQDNGPGRDITPPISVLYGVKPAFVKI